MARSWIVLFLLPTLALLLTIQNLWKVPDGGKGDLSQTFTSGQTLPLSWQALNDSTNDLWVTTFNYNEVQYSSLITRDIDISVGGSYTWTISIPASQLSKSAKYVLRFKKPHGDVYNVDSAEISSPGFLVLAASAITSSTQTTADTSSVSAQAATGTATPSLTPSASSSLSAPQSSLPTSVSESSTTSTPSAAAASSSLTSGAKAGIGVGVAAAGVALASLTIWLCFFRRRRRRRLVLNGGHGGVHAEGISPPFEQQYGKPYYWPTNGINRGEKQQGTWIGGGQEISEMGGGTPRLPELAEDDGGREEARGVETRDQRVLALSELPGDGHGR